VAVVFTPLLWRMPSLAVLGGLTVSPSPQK
jgi:hypothetical protein